MMPTNQIARTVIIVVSIFALASGVAISSAEQSAKAKSAPDQQVLKLLQERRSVLENLVEVAIKDYQIGKADVHTVTEAQQQLLLVELELAADHPQRVELLKKSADLARDVERIAEAQYRAGQARQTDVLQTHADRLKTEIALMREQQQDG